MSERAPSFSAASHRVPLACCHKFGYQLLEAPSQGAVGSSWSGGFIRTASNQCFWFSERFVKQDFTALQIPIEDELLAQIAIVFTLARTFPGHRVPIRIHSFSDNTGADSGSNKLFTMKYPQCLFVEKLCLLSATFSMELDVQHIAGKNNDEADALSRWSGSDTIPHGFDSSDRVQISLSDLWIPQVIPHVCPPHPLLLCRPSQAWVASSVLSGCRTARRLLRQQLMKWCRSSS